MDVRVRVFENAQRGGSSIGLFAGTQGDPAPVPEPGTMALLGSGLAMVFAKCRKRR